MREAVALSRQGIDNGDGGPFGCVIVQGDEIVGRGWNQVIVTNDPTAHAEVVAIRDACGRLGRFQLADCEVYTSCEPCPMCMGAIYWARPKRVFFANSRHDAAAIGFDDSFIYDELTVALHERQIEMTSLDKREAFEVFLEWKIKEDRTQY